MAVSAVKKIKDLFGFNNDSKVPLLRGKINLLFFVIFPFVVYKVVLKERELQKIPLAIFSLCAVFNFSSSLALHWKIWDQENYSVLRRIDYAGIFLMIGGAGLPGWLEFVDTDYMVVVTVLLWISLFAGVFSSLLFNFCYTTKLVRSIIYVLSALPYYTLVPLMIKRKYYSALFWVSFGGGCYTLGAFIYGFKFPSLIPGLFEYHELFHIFCLLGFSCVSITNYVIFKSHEESLALKILKFKSKF